MNKVSETLLSLAETLRLLANEVEIQTNRVDYVEETAAKNRETLRSMAKDILQNLN